MDRDATVYEEGVAPTEVSRTTEVGAHAPTVAETGSATGVEVREAIGRFTVLDVLGRGGMGVVLSARDPKLDRRVAIKLVHPGGRRSGQTEEVRARLLREARAMARLRHPNVLTVHEAGEHEGQVFVAMEEVAGGSLKDELARLRASDSRDWREVVKLFVEAGRGLAAAHDAGLIHRDFKPDNVLVDRDDSGARRVLVADFGLVGLQSAAGGGADDALPEDPPSGEKLTAADSVMGTPAYMAPEQHRGAALDARTDQFAFCVSLYEALYGELPFGGETRREYVEAILDGKVRPAPPSSRVPSWLREVLLRGLRPDPADRYPSMVALLAEFAEESLELGFRWRLAGGIIAGLGCVAVVLALLWPGSELSFFDLQASNGCAFLLVGLIYASARDQFTRSQLNRVLISALAVALVLIGCMHAGAQMLGLTPAQSLVMISFADAAMASLFAVGREWRLLPAGGGYLAAFFVGAWRPELGAAALMAGHVIAFANVILVFVPRADAADPPRIG